MPDRQNTDDIRQSNISVRQTTISVREMVEFLLRSGDIDSRHGALASAAAMAEGTRVHKKIQKAGGPDYSAEVRLRHIVVRDGYEIVIDGRADGIFTDKESGITFIDEIKGIYSDVTRMEEPIGVHLAQAKCYAYIYSLQQELPEIGVQMTYCDLDTEEIQRFSEVYTAEEIGAWFSYLIDRYVAWSDLEISHAALRDESIEALSFPFEYRPGQQKLCRDAYVTIQQKKTLFIQAPTGTGKTLNAIYPALKSMPAGLSDKLFYVTAKTVTASVALDTMELLAQKGCRASAVQLVAKEKLCVLDKVNCNPDDCPRARGHFDRINDALCDILTHEQIFTRELITAYAEKHMVCPFEFALDISLFADMVIGDYNYIFDPRVKLKRFFAEGGQGNYVFMVDEAHNLVDRAREMYSAVIVKEDVLSCRRLVEGYSKRAVGALTKLNTVMLSYKKTAHGLDILYDIDDLYAALCRAQEALRSLLEKRIPLPGRDDIMEVYFAIAAFVQCYEQLDEKYVIYSLLNKDGFSVKLFCADPSTRLQECIDSGRAAIFFSATLLPVNYYKKLISTRDDNYAVYATSVFDPENRLLLIADDVTSKYTERRLSTYEKVVSYIERISAAREGNYMVFFPSYAFLADTLEVWESRPHENVELLVQSQGMGEADRDAFVAAFDAGREGTLIGFCVLGGIFSEGIDLARDRLIGAVIVGTGLGGIDEESELLKSFFDESGENGYDYVYRFPGMNRVEQAAGRVIRTSEDRGVIALLDSRFLQGANRALFPREWSNYQVTDIGRIGQQLQEFWDGTYVR